MKRNNVLTPRFDVLPHGTRKLGNEVYMVFKMIVHIKEIEQGAEQYTIINDHGNWKELRKKINDKKWQYSLNLNGSSPATLSIHLKNDSTHNPINFVCRDHPYKPTKFVNLVDFNFGNRTLKSIDSFNFLNAKKASFHIAQIVRSTTTTTTALQPLRQFEPASAIEKASFKSADGDDLTYSKILASANEYARNYKVKSSIPNTIGGAYNFATIYSSILDEPEAAEHHFGIIREFWINKDEFLKIGKEFTYIIDIDNEKSNPESTFKFISTDLNGCTKYYNGPEVLTFGNKYFSPVNQAVTYELTDPYKDELDSNEKHPDGLYVKVIYDVDTDGNLKDPFDRDYVKGITPLIKVDDGPCYAITSIHRKLKFRSGGVLNLNKESGHLTPKAQLETTGGPFRNNILISWRGDNLSLNRVPIDLEEEDKDVAKEKGAMMAESPGCEEELFMQKNVLTKEETLQDSSQIFFNLHKKYRVYIRPLTPTNFFIRSNSEQQQGYEHELTAEDFIELKNAYSFKALEPENTYDTQSIPIKSPTMIGPKTYKRSNSDFVDKQTHLVLNRVKGENHETRYVYPPHAKMEDLKMLNYLSVDKISVASDSNGWASIDDYAKRCIRLEDKLGNKVPKCAWHRKKVDYLADPRAKDVVLVPADLFTASIFKVISVKGAFALQDTYPYYEHVKSASFRIQKPGKQKNAQSSLIIESAAEKFVQQNIKDGIYNFDLYVTDQNHSMQGMERSNAVPVRVSIVNKPDPRLIKKEELKLLKADRNVAIEGTGINPNLWFQKITFPDEQNTWKSAKYQERTEVLRIQNQDTDALLHLYNRVNTKKAPPLLLNEYPYELFLTNEGSLDGKSGLRTTLYPEFITIKGSYGKCDGLFFRMMLNDKETLEVNVESQNYIISIGRTVLLPVADLQLRIAFFPKKNAYILSLNGREVITLDHYISAEISINDITMPDDVLKSIQFASKDINFEFNRSTSYYFIADLGDPYSRKKTVQLFGSSIFQAYFPNSQSEFDMGVDGNWFDIAIPNNCVPTPPHIEAEVLLLHKMNKKWGNAKEKINSMQSLIRITLPRDFMIEGKNKLGIVIRKDIDGLTATDDFVSKIGEDITKLTGPQWVDHDLSALINLPINGFEGKEKQLLEKYIVSTDTIAYKIGSTIYHVLEFNPFYNTKTQKWQVVIPLLDFGISETMFLKFVTLKIAQGHQLIKNESKGYFEDMNGTSLSAFSEPAILPVYNKKEVMVKRNSKSYTISFNANAQKVYYVILTEDKSDFDVLNFRKADSEQQFESFVAFDLISKKGKESDNVKKVLCCKDVKSVEISKPHFYSIIVLEFEIHKNQNPVIPSGASFVDYNPLFDQNGLRLISTAKFRK